ncbi:hypothetical protein GY21_18660 [Cryobacterium roopkundense]|uniref:Uncharacterized protein n=1 Tax=Cryobacterium roopkundense TaxID=1001240 RepID=A0A099J1B5_9MICO|nr:hypothetical protein GY21_18660 [Cryobacterium roopkundense]
MLGVDHLHRGGFLANDDLARVNEGDHRLHGAVLRHPFAEHSGDAFGLKLGVAQVRHAASLHDDQTLEHPDIFAARIAHGDREDAARTHDQVADLGAHLAHRKRMEHGPVGGKFGERGTHGHVALGPVIPGQAVVMKRRPPQHAADRGAAGHDSLVHEVFDDRLGRESSAHSGYFDCHGNGSSLELLKDTERRSPIESPTRGTGTVGVFYCVTERRPGRSRP